MPALICFRPIRKDEFIVLLKQIQITQILIKNVGLKLNS